MDIRKINLNLLKILDAIYREKNITKAAQKLYLTQSAISTALNQLRGIFKDPLFVRKDKLMCPTPVALELEPLIKETILALQKIFLAKQAFVPQTSQRVFKIGVSEYSQIVFLPFLMQMIRQESNSIKLKAIHFRDCIEQDPFTDAAIDIGIGVSRSLAKHIQSEQLYTEQTVCIGHKNNPLLEKRLTLKQYTEMPHIYWNCDFFNVQTVTEIYLERNRIMRNEVLQVADLLSCLLAIKNNKQLISTVAQRLAVKISKDFGLIYQPVPFKGPAATVSVFWPSSANHDAGVCWLLEKVRETVKQHYLAKSVVN